MGNDLLLHVARWEVELDGHHPLPRRVLQVLEHTLVAGVVGHDEAEGGGGVEGDAEAVDRELAAMVGEGMQDNRRVLTGLDDLVQVADGTLAYGARQRAVDPRRVAALQEEAPDQVGRRQVVVTGHGDQRPLEVMGHGLDEAGLAAAGRPLEQDRQALAVRGLEHPLFVADRQVVGPRPFRHAVLLSTCKRSRVRSLRCDNRRCTSADATAERNSGPTTPASCVARGMAAWAAVPNTRRKAAISVAAPMLRHRHPVPRRRVSASARRASASP